MMRSAEGNRDDGRGSAVAEPSPRQTHHTWKAPIGIAAIYAHPIEHVVSNVAPVLLGPLLLGSHITVAWLWFAMVILSTCNVHSGYHFPLLPSPEFHDFHHVKFDSCYGVVGLLDCTCGAHALACLALRPPPARRSANDDALTPYHDLAGLFGTDQHFRASPQFRHHYMLLSLDSVAERDVAQRKSREHRS